MSSWEPIETAPKDGTEVLLWCPYDQRFTDDPGCFEIACCKMPIWRAATHWMPLPPAPAGEN